MSGNVYDRGADKYNIEHILPVNPGDDWSSFKDEQVERYVYRIGNMTPMDASSNRNLGNMTFADKLEVYRNSKFMVTRTLEDYREWTPSSIERRQKYLADQAAAIWRLSEFD